MIYCNTNEKYEVLLIKYPGLKHSMLKILEYVIGLFPGHANGSHARIRMRVTTQKYRLYMLSICLTEEFVPSLLGIQTPL